MPFLKAHSQSMSSNKQEFVALLQDAIKGIFSMHIWSSGQLENNAMTLPPPPHLPPSPFPCESCKRSSSGICTASQFQVQLPLLYTAGGVLLRVALGVSLMVALTYSLLRKRPLSGSCNLLQLLAQKIATGIHLCKPALLNCPKVWQHFTTNYLNFTVLTYCCEHVLHFFITSDCDVVTIFRVFI